MELHANQRWLRKPRRELLAAMPQDPPQDPFLHHVRLSVVEGGLDEMKTPAGAAEFRRWLRATRARHKLFWETAYLRT